MVDFETYVVKDSIKVVERFFTVPLDYTKPEGEKIRVFARNFIPMEKEKIAEELPYLLYLQGGPGFEVGLGYARHLASELHEKGYQTLWLDQRGTGLSTPFSAELVKDKSDAGIADYLKHFRADNIVRDCEHVRKILLGHKPDPEDRKWSILGQSYGGFCALTYLSFAPHGLKEAFLTGGLAPLLKGPDPVYERTKLQVEKRNAVYYRKYPQDVKRVRDILGFLFVHWVTLPNGDKLSPARFQQLGMKFGMEDGIDAVHEIVFRATNDLELFGKLSYKVLQTIQNEFAFNANPIYAILHESIYCQGQASNWSAARVLKDDPKLDWEAAMKCPSHEPVYFTGEMIFPKMFDEYANLRPLKGAAKILARYDGWGALYDNAQLARNEVKVTAATYVDDMYVDFGLAQETVRAVRGTEQFVTNQMFHDGLRQHTKELIGKLWEISKREYH